MDLKNRNTLWSLERRLTSRQGVTIFCHAHKRADEACLQRKERKEANAQRER